jgi:parallel beta helix pectate lyase-like protein
MSYRFLPFFILSLIFITGLSLWLVSASEAAAATYYASLSGNDENSCFLATTASDMSKAKRSITNAVDCLSPGDTLLVREGVYPSTRVSNVIGNDSAWITIKNYPGERPEINVANQPFPNAGRAMAIRFSSYLIVEGFEMYSLEPNEIRKSNHDLDWLHNPADFAIMTNSAYSSEGIHLNTAHHIIVRNNEFHHLGGQAMVANQAFEDGSGDYFHDNEFANNYAHHLGGYGTYICGNRVVIRGNHFYSTTFEGIRIGCVGGHPTTNFVIENNIMHENYPYQWFSRDPARMLNGGHGIVLCCITPDNIIIRNNIVYNWQGRGIEASGFNTLVANNTIYKTQSGPAYQRSASGGWEVSGTYARDGIYVDYSSVRIINNILNETGGIIKERGGVDAVVIDNLTTNPNFTNASSNDFHLQSTSPAKDAGATLPEVPCDFDGNGRPAGSAYDIGVYEQGGSPGSGCTPGPSGTPPPSSTPTPTPTPIPTPNITLIATPTTLSFPGQSTYLLWAVTNATSCTASGGWSGPRPPSGGIEIFTPTVTTTYTLTCTGAGGTSTASVTVTPAGAGGGYCHTYTAGAAIPAGFGVPWDVTNPSSLLLKAQCTGVGATLNLGDNNPLTYIYKNAHIARAGSSGWSPITLFGGGLISNNWFPRTASAMVSMTSTELSGTSHYVGFVCRYSGGWKCGCRDTACAQSYWQIQSFRR